MAARQAAPAPDARGQPGQHDERLRQGQRVQHRRLLRQGVEVIPAQLNQLGGRRQLGRGPGVEIERDLAGEHIFDLAQGRQPEGRAEQHAQHDQGGHLRRGRHARPGVSRLERQQQARPAQQQRRGQDQHQVVRQDQPRQADPAPPHGPPPATRSPVSSL